MDRIQRSSLLVFVLVLGAAAVAAEVYFLIDGREKARRAEVALTQRKQERDWLAGQSPSLSAANAETIASDLEQAQRRLAELRRELEGRAGWLPRAPVKPIDAYFAIASYVEQMRAFAVRQQIAVRPEERFGFASYANEGPEPDVLPAVHRQRVVAQHVLEALFEARPRALVAVLRERPKPNERATMASTNSPSRSSAPARDLFVPDARLQLRLPGLIDGSAMRVEFTGQTQTLRAFLNTLSRHALPVFVRSVEVEPLPMTLEGGELMEGTPVPLIKNNISKFAVTLEYVDVLPAPSI